MTEVHIWIGFSMQVGTVKTCSKRERLVHATVVVKGGRRRRSFLPAFVLFTCCELDDGVKFAAAWTSSAVIGYKKEDVLHWLIIGIVSLLTCVNRLRVCFNDEFVPDPLAFLRLNKVIFSLNDNFDVSSSKVFSSAFFSVVDSSVWWYEPIFSVFARWFSVAYFFVLGVVAGLEDDQRTIELTFLIRLTLPTSSVSLSVMFHPIVILW